MKVHDKAVLGEEETLALTLDELAREGARRMLAAALEAEVTAYIEKHQHERDEQGHRLVVRNGKAPSSDGDAGGRDGAGPGAPGR